VGSNGKRSHYYRLAGLEERYVDQLANNFMEKFERKKGFLRGYTYDLTNNK
jgi:hypothetical protein